MNTAAGSLGPFHPLPEPVPFDPDPHAELPRGADVVVVGAGIVGATVAYRLAMAGMRPLVIEANAPASGASGRNAGMALAGLGGHFPRVTRLVQESGARSIVDYTTASLRILEELDERLPGGIGWRRAGSLDLLRTEAELQHGHELAAMQRDEGLEVRMVAGRELQELAPALAVEEILGAAWTPGDGTLNPFRLVYGLLDAAVNQGATVVTGVRVEQLQVQGGRTSGVITSHGEVAAGAVLLATNAWTPALVPEIGDNLTPIREHVCVTEPLPPLLGPGFEMNQCNEYWRQMPTGEIVIGGYAVADEGMGIGSYSVDTRPHLPPLLAGLLARMHPALADARIVRCWAGLLDFASLEVPIAGVLRAAGGEPVPGAYVCCGLTGHGMPYAPILGLLLAEQLIHGEARSLSLTPFDMRRYQGNAHQPTWLEPFQGFVSLDR